MRPTGNDDNNDDNDVSDRSKCRDTRRKEREISSPVRVSSVGGRVSVVSSRLLLFNRVAKVRIESMMTMVTMIMIRG